MRRIYYLLDDINEAHLISDTLHENAIEDWQFHILAKDEAQLHRHHLHKANVFQKSDLIHSGERGALAGLAAGFYLALFVSPWSVAETSTLLYGLLALSVLGLIAGTVWGNYHENYKILHFHNDIENGKLLVMLDAKNDQHILVKHLMKNEFPQLNSSGEHDWFINPFETEALVPIK